ncbi:conserved hypothetical protein [Candidatus Desulfosporosinus infrequens]|uniref:Uncharacterized protein n=1 Tax=Candidatus Desulfosporosinus infrequens TaxID=2043169 RepID=A0A2U3KY75_9FIRM|nr:conserved hypothetical protein [Candidatus Desulfosporosinus infrequens]
MTSVITVSICGVLFLILLIILLKLRTGYNEIDEKYGKPYMANLVTMIGDHPDLKRGSMAISLHPKNAIAFNRKVFLFSQISSIKITSDLPGKIENGIKAAVNTGGEEYLLCIVVTDEYGKHEVIFSVKSEFKEVANQLIQKWNMYNLS